ncbi:MULTISPECIES: acyltransferase [Butyricimonas]|jgi:hypothetical protein|uniref:Acetyltransferase-like isoleucine patch superfamily enzyme n=2 Tax=Butyricimonas faecihominis TaxID=1472416 RepID=A0A7W6HUL1_9BACT|nr:MULTISPECIES: acyltransferase [Butyricimonas]MBB4025258.1 acetyltransferase-like isoleucine patch superfamily enzyme [Butyricimonas faecihominis]BEI56977.1 hypothetical protein Bfae18676_19520 [Butyricimonas faecihominis]GGJ22763.1 hypothetical protein GCM10007041_09890 [Butyricimonas faecihominis]
MMRKIFLIFKFYYYKIFYPKFYRNIKHGKNFRCQAGIDAVFPELIEIGDNFIAAPGSKILTHDASLLLFTDNLKIRAQKTTIGNSVFLGECSVVMPGVTINDNVIVGAGSIVTKDIPANSVVAGNPAKLICTVDAYIEKCKQCGILYDVSENFQNALNNGLPITIDCMKSIREKVYQQMEICNGCK